MSDEEDEIKQLFEELVEKWGELTDALRQRLDHHSYERLRAYGIGHVESGLGHDGSMFLPVPFTVAQAVEEACEPDDLEEEEEEVEPELGIAEVDALGAGRPPDEIPGYTFDKDPEGPPKRGPGYEDPRAFHHVMDHDEPPKKGE